MSSDYNKPEIRYKIILVGDAGTGKTSIFWRYIKNQAPLDHLITTIDFRYKSLVVQEQEVKLCIWDTAGQQKFRSIVATYFKSCDGVVLVFDLGNKKSFESIQNVWYDMAIKRVPNAHFLLLGAKKDIQITVDLKQVQSWCNKKGIFFVPTSAITGENIEQAFFTLAALIKCYKGDQVNVRSTFATSFSSDIHKTETTIEGDEPNRRKKASKKFQTAPSPSFYLNKNRTISAKKRNCCN